MVCDETRQPTKRKITMLHFKASVFCSLRTESNYFWSQSLATALTLSRAPAEEKNGGMTWRTHLLGTAGAHEPLSEFGHVMLFEARFGFEETS